MENSNFIENLAIRLGQNATVKNVFGDPVSANGKTIIPVAMVAYGFGGGYGKGRKKPDPAGLSENNKENGEGAGGGGGMCARPYGVYVISDNCTRFVPAFPFKALLCGLIGGFLLHKMVQKKQ